MPGRARPPSAGRHWQVLGMTGLMGWSVIVTMLLGAGVGCWLDTSDPGRHDWTLALLVAGLALGCLMACHWVAKEEEAIREKQQNIRMIGEAP